MTLREYHRKRDFSKTREPAAAAKVPRGERSIFVVQLHHASRRHFDFRLQVGNTLKSWAVPKGPSFDPTVKRLAVEVEDHPVAYAKFEGDIEHGYGKGHVDQFDKGVWATRGDPAAQLKKGHLDFQLFGKRLKGRWHLVRSGRKERQPAWFLIKAKDDYAGDIEADDLLDKKMIASTLRAAKTPSAKKAAKKSTARKRAVPAVKAASRPALGKQTAALNGARKAKPSLAFFKPELTRLREQPPAGDDWLHEVKWDGYRILAAMAEGDVRLWSRNGLPWEEKLPEIRESLKALGLQSAQLDGELIAIDSKGNSDFNALQQTLSGEASYPLVYVLFDMPMLEGFDLSKVPLLQRKTLLERVLKKSAKNLAYSSHAIGDGAKVFAQAVDHQLEGIVSKRVDAPYRPGRGDDWLKIKRLQSDEFAVVGYTAPKGSRTGFGSLLLARPSAGHKGEWDFAGRVGSGFTHEQLAQLTKSLATKGMAKPSFALHNIDPLLRDAHWIKPKTVAEVFFRGIGGNGLLRQPSLKTLRSDKSVSDLRRSALSPTELNPTELPHSTAARGSSSMATASTTARKSSGRKSANTVTITHPERVVFPDDGYTKQDVADYYAAVMDWFLPGVVQRPVSVIRCPEGTGKPCFFQKHGMAGLKHVGTVKLKEESGAQGVYLYAQDATAVLELVQFGAIEFHPWGALQTKPDQATYVIFDLDPGPDVAWSRVVAAARLLRTLLTQLGLTSFVRTTGGKGLHVMVPLNPGSNWTVTKAFAHAFASTVAAAHPQKFVAEASKAKRKGKIYLDYLRNSRGATSVASYSLRARPGAPVAVPLKWEELTKLKSGDQFDIRSTVKRLERLRNDPWDGADTLKQSLGKITAQLESMTPAAPRNVATKKKR